MKFRRDSTAGSIIELVIVIGSAIGIALLVQQFVVKPYRIPSGSMLPTLDIGQRVLVDRIGGRISTPEVGDVTVFHPPVGADISQCGNPGEGPFYNGPRSGYPCSKATTQQSEQTFIKRIVAGPGDTIEVRGGHAVVNGVAREEPYTNQCGAAAECNLLPIRIPAGHWFLMGDNRGQSDDSRFWGPIPESWIIGQAFATYWPPSRIGLL